MDVGQGTAIVIKNENGLLLYDTGGSSSGFSMANSVLLPFFESHNIGAIDYLVLSHLDNDHAGGAAFINKNMNVKHNLSPNNGCNTYEFSKNHLQGRTNLLGWEWRVLWPLTAVSGDKNDHSCVLKLEKDGHSILFAGDIEKSSEAQILALYKDSSILQSTILIAPHHGSRTSSSPEFVNAVMPRFVVFTSGNNNRWGFPAQEVVARYKSINASIFISGQQGRIRIIMKPNDIAVSTFREDEFKRWYFKAR